MQAKQMAACLQHLSPLLIDKTDEDVLMRFAEALGPVGQQPYAAVLKKIDKQITLGAENPPASQAVDLLNRISKVAQASGSSTPSKEFAATASVLTKLSDLSATEIFEQVSRALAAPAKASKPIKDADIDVRELADKLTTEAPHNERFDALVKDLSRLQKPILAAIAERFLGYNKPYKSKTDIVKAIRARQLQDALEKSRDRRISKIAV